MIPDLASPFAASKMLAGVASYLTAGILYLAFCGLLFAAGVQSTPSRRLFLASVVTAIWAFALALHAFGQSLPALLLFALEVVRNGAWIVFLTGITLSPAHGRQSWPIYLAVALPGIVLLTGIGLDMSGRLISPIGQPSALLFTGPLILAVVGLVVTEQLFRNTAGVSRWAMKFLCFAAGGMFAYDVFLYSYSLLYKEINAGFWAARGIIIALTVPMIAVAVKRKPDWSLDIFVSRHAAFYSASLIAVGVYLTLVAMGGYFIRLLGRSWADFIGAVFFFGSAIILLMILFSVQVRAEMRVFLAKHFYRNKYEYRDEWLRLIATLNEQSPDNSLKDRAIKALVQIVGGPSGRLWLKNDAGNYEVTASFDCPVPEHKYVVPADSSFIDRLRDREWIVDVARARSDASRDDSLEIPKGVSPEVHNHLIIPLKQANDLVGFGVVETPVQSFELTFEDIDLLRTVGRQIASYLSLHTAMQSLSESRQFEAFNRLSSFLMHDLKNIVSQQSLVVQNAVRHKNDPRFIDDAIETIESSVARMRKLLDQMGNKGPQGSLTCPNLSEVVRFAVASQSAHRPVPALEVPDGPVRALVDEQRCRSVLEHLIRNAQDATPADGSVRVRLDIEEGMAVITVTDSGAGMDEEFIAQKLFQPFYSTKGAQGMGIGAYQARQFARDAGGNLKVESEPGKGTRLTLSLPLD